MKVINLYMEGGIELGGYPIPQYSKKIWQIPKKGVKYQRNTDTAIIFGYTYLKLYPSGVFVYLTHLCISNQPQPLQGNVRRTQIDRYNDRKGSSTTFVCQKLCNHLPLIFPASRGLSRRDKNERKERDLC